jgi:hypothetical protein
VSLSLEAKFRFAKPYFQGEPASAAAAVAKMAKLIGGISERMGERRRRLTPFGLLMPIMAPLLHSWTDHEQGFRGRIHSRGFTPVLADISAKARPLIL